MSIDWTGLRVVVTGAASGIGRGLAKAAAGRGAQVAVVDIEAAPAEALAAELRESGATARAYGADVGDAEAMARLAAAVVADFGGVEALFNNAGVAVSGPVEKLKPTDVAWLLSVNLVGVINGVRAFAPHLRASAAEGRPAWVVNTGSEHSLGIPTFGASSIYTASKHAVLGLTDTLRHDFKDSGVRAAVLCPGLVSTRLYDSRRSRADAFGGPVRLSDDAAKRGEAVMSAGQDPSLTAELCFEGLDRGDFIIIADNQVRPFVDARIAEVAAAVARVEQRLG